MVSATGRSVTAERGGTLTRPDPVRRRREPGQQRGPAAQPGRPGGRHRHRPGQPDRRRPTSSASGSPCRSPPPAAGPADRRSESDPSPPSSPSSTGRAMTAQPQPVAISGQHTHPLEQALYEVKKVIVGQDHLLERMLVALLARGHILVEGVPGPGQDDGDQDAGRRRSAASSSGSSSPPTWCPPTSSAPGSTTRRTGEFQVSLGPVFTNLLLADEINRAPAKVQSALLEVMQERQVTIGRETYTGARPVPGAGHPEPDRDRGHLPAARGAGRPVHAQGAGRLPDADRGVRRRRADDLGGWSRPQPGVDTEQLLALQRAADAVYVDPALIEYAVRLAGATRRPGRGRPAPSWPATSPSAPARGPRST